MNEASGSDAVFLGMVERAKALRTRIQIKTVKKVEARTIVAQAERFHAKVSEKFPSTTPIHIRRLVVAALCVHQLRLTDISMRDKVIPPVSVGSCIHSCVLFAFHMLIVCSSVLCLVARAMYLHQP